MRECYDVCMVELKDVYVVEILDENFVGGDEKVFVVE